MSKFDIKGTEYEVKLTFKGIQELNKLYDSPLEFVGLVVSGSLRSFVDCLYAGLLHTEKGLKRSAIEKEVEEKIENGKLDLSDVMRIGYEVVNESFFYKKTVQNLLSKDPAVKAILEDLMK